MALKVNKILREEAEKEQKDVSISVYDYLTSYYNYVNADQLPYLGNDKERMDTFLDRMWEQFGNFSNDSSSLKMNKIGQELSEEVYDDLDKERNDIFWYRIRMCKQFGNFSDDPMTRNKTDKERMDTFLYRMCKLFGNFSDDPMTRNEIEQELSEEGNDLDKKCLRNESCWSIVEKGARSIAALSSLGQHPNAGSYLSHHMSRMRFIRSTEFDENLSQ